MGELKILEIIATGADVVTLVVFLLIFKIERRVFALELGRKHGSD